MQKKQSGRGVDRRRVVFGPREKKRLIQLCLCVCIFFVVLAGRSSEVADKNRAGDRVLQTIQENTDFVGAFSALGESISDGNSVWDSLIEFTKMMFCIHEDEIEQKTLQISDGPASKKALNDMMSHSENDVIPQVQEKTQMKDDSESEQLNDQNAGGQIPNETVQNNGPMLPANATMDYQELGLKTIITPVLGEIASPYGYRSHPLNGEFSFHPGVDIAADSGTPIKALADGVVEFIGESDSYGLYVQLDHGNDIKSFYCHCSELLLGKGKPVTAGQTIALVGDTGNTTGSHLHLELKSNGILLNPLNYIDSIS